MAASRKRSWKRRLALAALAVVLFMALAGLAVGAGGRFLVESDTFSDADIVVVLSGGQTLRTLTARDLYRAGRVRHILIIPEPPPDLEVKEELIKLGLVDPSEPAFSERILVASGIPRAAFEFLPEPADGTINEARGVRRFLADRPAKRIVVVTSKFASRRACLIFRRVLDGREVYCAPSSYDRFDPRGWWRQPRDALSVVMEYQKLAANLVSLAFAR
jgi:uncharacterized SAM-binding protein YcdF (DUF218 family)